MRRLLWMVLVLLIVFIAFNTDVFAARKNCRKNPIYCKIVKIKPSINKKYAMKLSNVIYKYSKKYRIKSYLIVAIFAQESMFNMRATNCCTGLDNNGNKKTVCVDFGIGQINYINMQKLDIDETQLFEDMDYSVHTSVKILYDFKRRYAKREKHWWTRYNSGSRYWRNHYYHLVSRFIKK